MATLEVSKGRRNRVVYLLLFLVFLYLFLLAIHLMGEAFSHLGANFARTLLATTSDPFSGLFIGLLATAVVQSSSSTTSIVVGMVAGGVLTLHNAIPMIMGANIGTTVTNTLVSLGHIRNREEFRKAFAASVVHDIFNILTVLILFPLEMLVSYLARFATLMTRLFGDMGGLKLSSPLKAILAPVGKVVQGLTGGNAVVLLIVAIALLFISLILMVKFMKLFAMGKAGVLFDRLIFKSPVHGLLFGMILTAVVQSSSVTTSLIVPLAGAGLLRMDQVFPYTMGANVGTTITAILASLATGQPTAVSVALAHMLFNVSGIAVFWWIRWLPIGLAEKLAAACTRNRLYALVYILAVFFLLPLACLWLRR